MTIASVASCRICEYFAGCRGKCRGQSGGVACRHYERVTNRDGNIDPVTGDLSPAAVGGRAAVELSRRVLHLLRG